MKFTCQIIVLKVLLLLLPAFLSAQPDSILLNKQSAQRDPLEKSLVGKWDFDNRKCINGSDTTIQHGSLLGGDEKTDTSRPDTHIEFMEHGIGMVYESYYCAPYGGYEFLWSLDQANSKGNPAVFLSLKVKWKMKSLKWIDKEFSGKPYLVNNNRLLITNKNGCIYSFIRQQ